MVKNKRGRLDLFMKSKLLQIKIFDNRLFTFCFIKEFVYFWKLTALTSAYDYYYFKRPIGIYKLMQKIVETANEM